MLPFYFAPHDEKERAFARLAFGRPLHAAVKRYFDAREFLTFDLRPDLTRVTAPTLIVAGQEDFILHPSACREAADSIANARLVVMEDVGHFPWVERPEELTRLVDLFLD